MMAYQTRQMPKGAHLGLCNVRICQMELVVMEEGCTGQL